MTGTGNRGKKKVRYKYSGSKAAEARAVAQRIYNFEDAMRDLRPVGGLTHIYVLMFNLSQAPTKPFYVGQAKNPRNRFNNHQMLMWHFAKFGRKADVCVAGLVPDAEASKAEQDLIRLLSLAEYRLLNSVIKDRAMSKRQERYRLREHLEKDIRDYLSVPKKPGSVLLEWQHKWADFSALTDAR